MRRSTMILAVCALALAGCADTGPKQGVGALVGGLGGGILGSTIGSGTGRLVATGIGTFIGAAAGSEIGRSLDRADRLHAARAYGAALEYNPSGAPVTWSNPDSGNYGTVVPVRTYQRPTGQYCREYQTTIIVGGRAEQAFGTACREPDGSWRMVG